MVDGSVETLAHCASVGLSIDSFFTGEKTVNDMRGSGIALGNVRNVNTNLAATTGTHLHQTGLGEHLQHSQRNDLH